MGTNESQNIGAPSRAEASSDPADPPRPDMGEEKITIETDLLIGSQPNPLTLTAAQVLASKNVGELIMGAVRNLQERDKSSLREVKLHLAFVDHLDVTSKEKEIKQFVKEALSKGDLFMANGKYVTSHAQARRRRSSSRSVRGASFRRLHRSRSRASSARRMARNKFRSRRASQRDKDGY